MKADKNFLKCDSKKQKSSARKSLITMKKRQKQPQAQANICWGITMLWNIHFLSSISGASEVVTRNLTESEN